MRNNVLILIAVVVLVGAGFYLNKKAKSGIPSLGVVCTMEAKMCPDGSYVGRSGPKCEFAQCPIVSDGTSAKINQTILNKGVYITPLKVVSDSRCAVDVQCIQAGTVVLNVRFSVGTSMQTKDITLGKSISLDGITVELETVTPAKHSKETLRESDYQFGFYVR